MRIQNPKITNGGTGYVQLVGPDIPSGIVLTLPSIGPLPGQILQASNETTLTFNNINPTILGAFEIIQTSQNITTNATIPIGNNALSVGPIIVNSGVTITVSSGSVWTII